MARFPKLDEEIKNNTRRLKQQLLSHQRRREKQDLTREIQDHRFGHLPDDFIKVKKYTNLDSMNCGAHNDFSDVSEES